MSKLDFFGRIQNAGGGSGTVTGSGTTNYVSKWTSSTAQGNSLIYDDGTIVVIGGTSATSTSVGDAQFTLNGTVIGLGHKSGTQYIATYNDVGSATTGVLTNADDMLIGDGEGVNAGIYIYIRQNVGAQTGININGNLLAQGVRDISGFRNLTMTGYSDSASYKVGGVAGATGGTYTTITSITVANGIITAISGS